MVSDKNKNLLEKQLKTLGKKIRIDILKKLSSSQVPLTYSALQKEVLGNNSSSTNFSFHLNNLKEANLIDSLEDGYSITPLGKQILKNILSIEKILNVQTKSIMIRTSKYSKEPFNLSKVEEYLVKEGNMELYQAKQIAQEVEERLSKTNIEYLTTPLMREYINAILLENGLEKIRHKLTRLGTPPFEVSKYFNDSNLNSELFIKTLGSEISEQYLLLNLLPNRLADLYLSGDVYLLYLNYWSLKPIGFYLNTSNLVKYLIKSTNFDEQSQTSNTSIKLILGLSKIFRDFKSFFSEDLLLGNFNMIIDLFNQSSLDSNFFCDCLFSELINFNSNFLDNNSHLTIDLKALNKPFIDKILRFQEKYHQKLPNLMIPFSTFIKRSKTSMLSLLNSKYANKLTFYNDKKSGLMNSTLNYVNHNDTDFEHSKIILDKIFINLHSIALRSNQNDDLFLELVRERLDDVFQFYSIKKALISKKLNSSKVWRDLSRLLFNSKNSDWIINSTKAVSFFGLNKAIKIQCGIELDRIDKSEKFALKIIALMRDIIQERNIEEKEEFVLNQPHQGPYLNEIWTNNYSNFQKNISPYSMDIIRKNSNLSLDKQLIIYKKFERMLDGGSIFKYYPKSKSSDLMNVINKILDMDISAFSIISN